jgi:hypothetical protein
VSGLHVSTFEPEEGKKRMKTISFRISKNSCRTTPVQISGRNLQMLQFPAGIGDIAIVLEDKGTRSVYYSEPQKPPFTKFDPLEFQRIWLEYTKADTDCRVDFRVS